MPTLLPECGVRGRSDTGPGKSTVLCVLALCLINAVALPANAQPPPAPELYYPFDDTTLNPSPGFDWEAVSAPSGINGYRLEVSASPVFGSLVVQQSVASPGYVTAQPLTAGRIYYWRVWVTDGAGASSVSSVRLLEVLAEPIRYHLEVATGGVPVLEASGLAQLSYTGQAYEELAEGPTYTWQVIATDPAGNARASPSWDFTLADDFGPTAPQILYPADGAALINARVGLAWSAANDPSTPVTYSVQLSEVSSFSSTVVSQSGLTTPRFALPVDLARGRIYYARAGATDAAVPGNTTWGASITFSIAVRAVVYDLVVQYAGAVRVIDRQDLPVPQYMPLPSESLLETVPYTWWVTARDEAGNSRASNQIFGLSLSDSFAPPPPGLVYPRPGESMLNPILAFDWTDAGDPSGPTRYALEVSTTSNFAAPVLTRPDLVPSSYAVLAAEALDRGATYYWRVRATDPLGNSSMSVTATFVLPQKAVDYRLEVADDPLFASARVDRDEIATTSYGLRPDEELPERTDLFWRVTAEDEAGNTRLSTQNYMLRLADNYPPPPVETLYPRDKESLLNPALAFDWTDVTDSSGAVTYVLEVSTSVTFAALTLTSPALSISSYAIAPGEELARDATYFWRVRATDPGGNTSTSATAQFDLQARDRSYRLEVSDDPLFATGATVVDRDAIGSLSYILHPDEALAEEVDLYWRVTAEDAAGNTRLSNQTYMLRLADNYPPPLPELLYPRPDETLLNPAMAFDWTAVTEPSGVVTYSLEVSTSVGFASLSLLKNGLNLSSYAILPGEELNRDATYFWRVRVTDAAGNQATTPPATFALAARAPTYTLEVSDDGLFATALVFRDEIATMSYGLRPDEELPEGTDLFWRATAEDEAGNTRLSTQTFALRLADNYPPPLPELLYPPVDATVINPELTFVWTSVVDNPPVTYDLHISRQSDFSTLVHDLPLTTTGYTLGAGEALQRGETYYWRIRVADGLGNAVITAGWPVAIATRDPTYTFDLAVDDGSPSPLDSPLLSESGVEATQYTLRADQELSEGVPYLWRVTGTDAAGNTTLSPVFAFQLQDIFPPSIPALLYPVGGDILNPKVSLMWESVADGSGSAVSYDLEVSTDPGFGSTWLAKAGLSSPSYTPALGERFGRGATYHWRVGVTDAVGNRDVSPAASFSVVIRGTTYSLQIATDAAVTDLVYDAKRLGDTRHTVEPWYALSEGKPYFWRVIANDLAGNGRSTGVYTFTIADTFAPQPPELLFPRANDVLINDAVGFAWTNVEDPSGVGYRLVVDDSDAFDSPEVFADTGSIAGYQLAPLDALPRDKNYFWRVDTRDLAGNESIGEARVFGVASKEITYRLEIATDPGFASIVRSYDGLSDTTYTVPLDDNLAMSVPYTWRVWARDVLARETVSSSTFSFTIQALPYLVPGAIVGNYYDGVAFDDPKLERLDPAIDFPLLADGNPFGDFDTEIGNDTFSVRWEGWVLVDFPERYMFYGTADDGQRLWINGVQLFNDWQVSTATAAQGSIDLEPGWHSLRYETFENLNAALSRLEIESASTSRKIIPSDHLAIIGNPADATPPQLVDVYLIAASPNSATVHVVADEPAKVVINYGPTPAYTNNIGDTTLSFVHDILLVDAPAGTLHYQVVLTDMVGNASTSQDILACTPTLAQITAGGIRGLYFEGLQLDPKVHEQVDPTIDFSGATGDVEQAVGLETFSIRWDGMVYLPLGGDDFVFHATSDDGQRLFIDGIRIINDWIEHTETRREAALTLTAGWHALRYEMFQNAGAARALLEIGSPLTPPTPIAANALGVLDAAYYAPVFGPIAPLTPIEATSPSGTAISLDPPLVSDCRDPSPSVTTTASGIFPLGTSQVTWVARNRFGEEVLSTQEVEVEDTLPPVIDPGPDRVLACDAPLGDGFTPTARVTLNTPTVVDAADAAPIWVDDAPALLPLGDTDIMVTATDRSGNQSQASYTVTVVDSGELAVDAGVDLFAPRAVPSDCTQPDGFSPGTAVRLAEPVVSGTCNFSSAMTITHNYPPPATSGINVCLPPGTTPIIWSASSAAGANGTATVNISVIDADFDIVIDNAPGGWVNVDAAVAAHIVGAFSAPLTWTVNVPAQPTTATWDNLGNYQAVFAEEAIYCPLNLVVIDSMDRKGADLTQCFGIDRTPPRTDFEPPTMWVSELDSTLEVSIQPGDPATYPHFFTGEDLPLVVRADDGMGPAVSGLTRVTASWIDLGPDLVSVLYDGTFATTGFLPTGVWTAEVAGCSDPGTCVNGGLDLAAIGRGLRAVRVEAVDAAGNLNTDVLSPDMLYMSVREFKDGLDAAVVWTDGLLNSSPPSAQEALTAAKGYFVTASRLHLESPGHSFLLTRQGWDSLDEANSYGAPTAHLAAYLPRAMKSDARRLIEVTQARGLTDWSIFGPTGEYLNSPNISGEYIVDVNARLAEATTLLDLAGASFNLEQYRTSIQYAILSHVALAVLFQDQTFANLFGTPLHYVDPPADTIAEGFFANGVTDDFGIAIAQTVANRLDRIDDVPGIPIAVVQILADVKDKVSLFNTGVSRLESGDPTFSNDELMTEIFLNAHAALDDLATIQRSAFATDYSRMGMFLTLALIMNFSLYSAPAAINTHLRINGVDPDSPMLNVMECRFDRMMSALSVGDLDTAVDLYQGSKCLMIGLYNVYYGGGQVHPDDACLFPEDYGCISLPNPQGICVLTDEVWDPAIECP